ncbi:hypothetical protein LTS18_001195, partial [Coniosporium uncinatum]
DIGGDSKRRKLDNGHEKDPEASRRASADCDSGPFMGSLSNSKTSRTTEDETSDRHASAAPPESKVKTASRAVSPPPVRATSKTKSVPSEKPSAPELIEPLNPRKVQSDP